MVVSLLTVASRGENWTSDSEVWTPTCKRFCRRQLRWLGCLGFSYSTGTGEHRHVALLLQRFKLVLFVHGWAFGPAPLLMPFKSTGKEGSFGKEWGTGGCMIMIPRNLVLLGKDGQKRQSDRLRQGVTVSPAHMSRPVCDGSSTRHPSRSLLIPFPADWWALLVLNQLGIRIPWLSSPAMQQQLHLWVIDIRVRHHRAQSKWTGAYFTLEQWYKRLKYAYTRAT